MDGARLDPRIKQLTPVGFYQVKVQTWADRRMAGSSLRKKKHRVLCPHWIRVEHIVEKLAGIGELRFKTGKHLIPYRITAGSDARPDCSHKIFRARPKLQSHAPHSGLDNPLHRPTPAGMESSHGTKLAVGDQYRNAVRRLNPEQQPGLRSDQPISLSRRFGRRIPGVR